MFGPEGGMRKTKKSAFCDLFVSTANFIPPADGVIHVVDGGHLLHQIVWNAKTEARDVVKKYISYVQNHFTLNSCIVFDGYDTTGTISFERVRRVGQSSGGEILFNLNTFIPVKSQVFYQTIKIKSSQSLYYANTYIWQDIELSLLKKTLIY